MHINIDTLIQILEMAIANQNAEFTEQDVLALGSKREHELIYHLDYLADKGFIIGEFIPLAFPIHRVSPK